MGNSPDNVSVTIAILNYEDVIFARQKVREMMNEMKFSLLDQTRVVTAVSELSRNIIVHAGKGQMTISRYDGKNRADSQNRIGFTCIFEDKGPGIADLEMAMKEGYSTTKSLGLGLSGSKKLCRNFSIKSTPGKGTRIEIAEWK
ncbi:MAG: anti-sigma regulatory factor [Desulfamplus sp.]|nr:anti-sigma regulatory factor [Desulfamplus sp.]